MKTVTFRRFRSTSFRRCRPALLTSPRAFSHAKTVRRVAQACGVARRGKRHRSPGKRQTKTAEQYEEKESTSCAVCLLPTYTLSSRLFRYYGFSTSFLWRPPRYRLRPTLSRTADQFTHFPRGAFVSFARRKCGYFIKLKRRRDENTARRVKRIKNTPGGTGAS